MSYSFVALSICGAILCLAAACIMKFRTERSVSGTRRKDIFDVIIDRCKDHLDKYGNTLSLNSYLAFGMLCCAGISLFLVLMRVDAIIAVCGGIIGLLIPEAALRFGNGRKQKQFESRYAQALQQMAASLRSGLTIQQSVSDLCHSPFIHESVKKSFRQIDADMKIGISVKEAFMRAANALGNEDAQDVALSLSIQNTLGGNESKVVETVARNISSRIILRREIKSLFADANITILTMDIMPLVIIFGLVIGSPQYIEVFFQTPAMTAVFSGIILFTMVGSFIIRKVVKRGTGGR